MATQQFGYGPGVWAPAKGVGAVAIPKLLQPGAVTPEFKPENPYKALAAKAIGEMAYAHFLGGRGEGEGGEEFKALPDKDLSGKLMGSDGTFAKSIVDNTKSSEDTPEKSYTIVYKEVGPNKVQKAVGIEGDYPWETDPEGFLTNKRLELNLPDIFKLLPRPDEKGTWEWKGTPPMWKWQPPSGKRTSDGGDTPGGNAAGNTQKNNTNSSPNKKSFFKDVSIGDSSIFGNWFDIENYKRW
jgi:hypothetical protein